MTTKRKSKGNKGDTRMSRSDLCDYVADICRQLAVRAREERMEHLPYLLDMVVVEADAQGAGQHHERQHAEPDPPGSEAG